MAVNQEEEYDEGEYWNEEQEDEDVWAKDDVTGEELDPVRVKEGRKEEAELMYQLGMFEEAT